MIYDVLLLALLICLTNFNLIQISGLKNPEALMHLLIILHIVVSLFRFWFSVIYHEWTHYMIFFVADIVALLPFALEIIKFISNPVEITMPLVFVIIIVNIVELVIFSIVAFFGLIQHYRNREISWLKAKT